VFVLYSSVLNIAKTHKMLRTLRSRLRTCTDRATNLRTDIIPNAVHAFLPITLALLQVCAYSCIAVVACVAVWLLPLITPKTITATPTLPFLRRALPLLGRVTTFLTGRATKLEATTENTLRNRLLHVAAHAPLAVATTGQNGTSAQLVGLVSPHNQSTTLEKLIQQRQQARLINGIEMTLTTTTFTSSSNSCRNNDAGATCARNRIHPASPGLATDTGIIGGVASSVSTSATNDGDFLMSLRRPAGAHRSVLLGSLALKPVLPFVDLQRNDFLSASGMSTLLTTPSPANVRKPGNPARVGANVVA
jgi:hypothetical protein